MFFSKPDIISESPNKEYRAFFYYFDQIRFGPNAYDLRINTIKRFFSPVSIALCGDSYIWSPDSNYFAVQLWMMDNFVNPALMTNLMVINISEQRKWVEASPKEAWVEPIRFEGNYIHYNIIKYTFEGASTQSVKVSLPNRGNENCWKKI